MKTLISKLKVLHEVAKYMFSLLRYCRSVGRSVCKEYFVLN
jgi:hypothetical protein